MDSMQVYRGMDIGTAKPSVAEVSEIPHHLVDVADPGVEYSVAEFQLAGRAVLDGLSSSGIPGIICGGSGLHFRALVDPLEFPPTDSGVRALLEATSHEDLVAELLAADGGAGDHLDLANPRRVLRAVEIVRLTGETPTRRAAGSVAAAVRDYRAATAFIGIGVDPGDSLGGRVRARLDVMLEQGWMKEVTRLGGSLGATSVSALGYRELADVAAGRLDLSTARTRIERATMSLAKRQRTFFRRDPRIEWLPWHDDADARAAAAIGVLRGAGWTS